MKSKFLITAFVITAIIAGCGTAYKSGQTPDDVYYSPANERSGYIEQDNNRYSRYNDREERQIRMKAYDYRWRYIDDDYDYYSYRYSPYYYGYNHGYYYNPYYYPAPVYFYGPAVNPKNHAPRMTGLGSYYNNNGSVKIAQPSNTKSSTISSTKAYSNTNSGNKVVRRIIGKNNSDDNDGGNNNRSYNPSSSGSSGSGSNLGGQSISRPSRN